MIPISRRRRRWNRIKSWVQDTLEAGPNLLFAEGLEVLGDELGEVLVDIFVYLYDSIGIVIYMA